MGTKMWLFGTNVEFKYRSIFRESAKFWFTKEENLTTKNPMRLQQSNSVVKSAEYGMLLEKIPNQRSMHSIIISEEPITNYTPLEMPQRFPIVLLICMWQKLLVLKFDILSQRGNYTDDTMK
jgi:DNA polymerase-3 subunit alpha/error-prone DNA polymerase